MHVREQLGEGQVMGSAGHGRGTFAEATQPTSYTFEQQVEWCRVNVPDEHAPFAAMAGQTLALKGESITPDAIRAHLKATGRNRGSLNG